MILNESQAKAVWDSFCALENISPASLDFRLPNGRRVEFCTRTNKIRITPTNSYFEKWEHYETKEDFASAYNI